MPVQWTEPVLAKLYAFILQVCDVRPTEAQKLEIAALMGPGCTAKAITHRLSAMRKAVDTDVGSIDTSTLTGNATSAGTTKKTATKKPKARADLPKRSPGLSNYNLPRHVKKEATPESAGDSDTLDPGHHTPPLGAKKRRPSTDPDFRTGQDIAVGEEVGEGLRAKKAKYDDGF